MLDYTIRIGSTPTFLYLDIIRCYSVFFVMCETGLVNREVGLVNREVGLVNREVDL